MTLTDAATERLIAQLTRRVAALTALLRRAVAAEDLKEWLADAQRLLAQPPQPDDAEFVEAMAHLTDNPTAQSILLSPLEYDHLVALARQAAPDGWLEELLHTKGLVVNLRQRLADAEVEAKRFRTIFTESLGNCSTDYTDFQMAVCGAEGWRIRATDAEARVREVEEAAQGVLERGCACADYGESARETEAAWTRLVVALARRTTSG